MMYDYGCDDCQLLKEEEHGMTEEPEIMCPECGKKMRQIITGGQGFIMGGIKQDNQYYIDKKGDEFKNQPEKDPYRKWRN